MLCVAPAVPAWSNAPWLRSMECSFDVVVELLADPELLQDATQSQDVSCVDQQSQQEQQEQAYEEITHDELEPYAFYLPAPYEYAPSAPSPCNSSAPLLPPPLTPRIKASLYSPSGSSRYKRANSEQSDDSLCSATSTSIRPQKRVRSRGELPSNVALLEHVALTLERVGKSGRRWEPCAKAWNMVAGEGHQMSPDNLKMSVKRLLQERKSRPVASQWDALGRAGSLGEVQSMLGTAFALLGPSWPVVEMAAFVWADPERLRRNYSNLASWPADVRELIEAETVRLHRSGVPVVHLLSSRWPAFTVELMLAGRCDCAACRAWVPSAGMRSSRSDSDNDSDSDSDEALALELTKNKARFVAFALRELGSSSDTSLDGGNWDGLMNTLRSSEWATLVATWELDCLVRVLRPALPAHLRR